jgi:phage regulator Rha-like protein
MADNEADAMASKNNLIKLENINDRLAVSSRVVAERLEKNHRDVLESLDKIANDGYAEVSADLIKSTYVNGQNKQLYREYLLTRKGLYVYFNCINGYVKEKMAFFDRFEEMEQKLKEQQKPFSVPANFKEALKLALEQQEEMERKHKLLADKYTRLQDKQETIELIADDREMRVYRKNLRIEANKLVRKISENICAPYDEVWRDAYRRLFEIHLVKWKYDFWNSKNKLEYLANKEIQYLKDLKDILTGFLKTS